MIRRYDFVETRRSGVLDGLRRRDGVQRVTVGWAAVKRLVLSNELCNVFVAMCRHEAEESVAGVVLAN